MVYRMLTDHRNAIVVSILARPGGRGQPLTSMPKPLAHDSYGAWREGQHDDLVLATAVVAC